jgi:CRP/FNR family transcriptional regulator
MTNTVLGLQSVRTPATACSGCPLRTVCLPVGLTTAQWLQIDARLVSVQRPVARGASLFSAGDTFQSVYVVRRGFFKTTASSRDGRDQVTGFQLAGDLLGLDGIATQHHQDDAVALEPSLVCVMPFGALEQLSVDVASLQHHFHRRLGREIVRSHGAMLLLGSMHADERIAAFLLNLAQRMALRGVSASVVLLPMSRVEIGSCLGLRLETVSRTLAKFQADGLLHVRHRLVQILDAPGLQDIVDRVAAGQGSGTAPRQPQAAAAMALAGPGC